MRDDLRNFYGEYEVIGSSGGPVVDRASRRTSVESRIHFDRSKLRCIVRKKIMWLHARGIEAAFPTRSRECTCAEKNSRQRVRTLNLIRHGRSFKRPFEL